MRHSKVRKRIVLEFKITTNKGRLKPSVSNHYVCREWFYLYYLFMVYGWNQSRATDV